MNKLGEGVSAQVSEVPAGYDLEKFTSLVTQIDKAMLTGELLPDFALDGLQSILNGGLLVRDFPVWKTLTFNYRDLSYYAAELKKIGCSSTSAYLAAIPTFERMLFVGSELDLVLAAPLDLGFGHQKRVKCKTFYARAQQCGLLKAWLEVAIMLRLSYLDQPNGEWLTVSCGENVDPDHVGTHMRVGRGVGQPSLEVRRLGPDDLVSLDQKFVFIKPRMEAAS